MYFPNNEELIKAYTAQSLAFGHRFRTDQTVEEYLLEFLQVLISRKSIGREIEIEEYFPEVNLTDRITIEFKPKSRVDLKRFTFYSKTKIESRTKIDDDAYEEMISILKKNMDCDDEKKDENVRIIENLLVSFSGVTKDRSWYAQSFIPICRNMILPETMGDKVERKKLDIKYKESLLKSDLYIGNNEFERKNELDTKFQTNRYNFMARGGEVYYLHMLKGMIKNPELKEEFKNAIDTLLDEFKQIDMLCEFIHRSWVDADEYREDSQYDDNITKKLGAIPDDFGYREKYSIEEVINLLNSSLHPFEKIEILSQGIIFQLMNLMHSEARFGLKESRPAWVVDMTYLTERDAEVRKVATKSYQELEDDILKKLHYVIEQNEYLRTVSKTNPKNTSEKKLKEAINHSYKLCRKLLKDIGVLVPIKGDGMRLTLQENMIKFLVVSIIKPGKKLTLDTFIEKIHEHFGIVIGREQYKIEMNKGNTMQVYDFSFLDKNEKEFSEMLKKCGFLRDLSDATSIVENPY